MVDCIKCTEIYDNEPPCDECDKPDLMSENELAWRLWVILSKQDRPQGFSSLAPIPTISIKNLCSVYYQDGDLILFEKILLIENIIFPRLLSQYKNKKGK